MIQVIPDGPNWIFAKVNLLACEQSARLPATSLWSVTVFDKQLTSRCPPSFIFFSYLFIVCVSRCCFNRFPLLLTIEMIEEFLEFLQDS